MPPRSSAAILIRGAIQGRLRCSAVGGPCPPGNRPPEQPKLGRRRTADGHASLADLWSLGLPTEKNVITGADFGQAAVGGAAMTATAGKLFLELDVAPAGVNAMHRTWI